MSNLEGYSGNGDVERQTALNRSLNNRYSFYHKLENVKNNEKVVEKSVIGNNISHQKNQKLPDNNQVNALSNFDKQQRSYNQGPNPFSNKPFN